MPKNSKNLKTLRAKVDRIDDQILKLLRQRGKMAVSIGKVKRANGQKIFAPHREQQVLKKLTKVQTQPFSQKMMAQIFRKIISATRLLEARSRRKS